MSIWDNYKEKIKNQITIPQGKQLLTEKQWFDLSFLSAVCINNTNAKIVDVMQDFAEVYGEWNEKYNCYKWQKLITCADYYGYDWSDDKAHNSLSDCRATLFCYQQLQCNK